MLDKVKVARDLYDEIRTLFPEFKPFLLEGDEENSTIILLDFVDSLEKAKASPDDKDLMERLDRFREWAEDYPRGEDATNDVFTWYYVSFVERILEHETLYRLAPAIIAKESLVQGKDYFYTWIGQTEYHRALTAFHEDDIL